MSQTMAKLRITTVLRKVCDMQLTEAKFLTAGKLAEQAGCQTQTVRRYDALDLLKPVARDSAGRRLYELSQVEVLRRIVANRIANRGFVRRA